VNGKRLGIFWLENFDGEKSSRFFAVEKNNLALEYLSFRIASAEDMFGGGSNLISYPLYIIGEYGLRSKVEPRNAVSVFISIAKIGFEVNGKESLDIVTFALKECIGFILRERVGTK